VVSHYRGRFSLKAGTPGRQEDRACVDRSRSSMSAVSSGASHGRQRGVTRQVHRARGAFLARARRSARRVPAPAGCRSRRGR
jgi:hypothetical protein